MRLSKRRDMKSILFHNIRLKLFALLLAIISWHAIRQTISFETSIGDIPIEIKLSSGWAVLDQSDNTVNVTFRGAQEDIRLIDQKQLKAVIDLSADSSVGPVDVNITPADIKGVRAARVVGVEPDFIRISLDKEAEKPVPVNSRTVGRPYHGEVEQTICEPSVVLIRGPERQLERTEWVSTEPIDVANRVQSFTKRVYVLSPSATQPLQIEPPDVLVHVILSEHSESFEWKDVPVQIFMRPDSPVKATISPARVNVKVTGRAEVLEKMADIVPKVFVDCVDLDPSLAYDLPVNIYLATGREVSAVADPAFVHVVLGHRNH